MSDVKTQIQGLRKEYGDGGLEINEMLADPFAQFKQWFDTAVDAGLKEPNGMAVTTCNANGRPSTRIALLKHYDERGFVFYTNYNSRKGEEIASNPFGAMTFWWVDLERQIRIEGAFEKVSAAESDAYYNSRPRGSRLGAWVSPQSEPITNRNVLDERKSHYESQFPVGEPVPRPDHWGGYRLVPDRIEFWQGRPNRLHDRLRYVKLATSEWQIGRLAP